MIKPNNNSHCYSFEEAFYGVPEYAKRLQVNVPITLEKGGTFRYFGNGEKVYEYRIPDEYFGWGRPKEK